MAKRLLGAAAAVVLLGTVTAAWSGDIRVGFINPTGPPAFWNQVNATMLAAASQLGIDVDIRGTERSRDKAIAYVRKRFMSVPLPVSLVQVTMGGVLVAIVGVLVGHA